MPSHNSPASGLQPDPYTLALWLNYSPPVSKHRTRASGHGVSTLCYDAALSMPLESKSELKVEGPCKSDLNTMTPAACAIKEKSHEELCSPSCVDTKIEELYHEENGSIQSGTAVRILTPCPGETFFLPPASAFGIEGCACSRLMHTFNGLCEHRTQSVHFDYDDDDDGENDNGNGNEHNSGKDVSEGNIELSDICSEDEQAPSVEVPASRFYSDTREVTSLNIVANHQNHPLHNLSPTELPEPKDVTDDAAPRPYEVPDPTVELASRFLFPISDRTNMPVLDPNGQLCAELHQHPQTFDSEGGDLRGENHGGLMRAGCQRLDTHPKLCHIKHKSFFDSVRLNLSARTLCYLALNKPSSCRLVFSPILKFVRDDCSPSVSASRRGFYILQRPLVVRWFGALSRRSVHLRLTGNYRYRTNASCAGGSGSSSGQGDFNFSFSGQYGGESSFGGYGAGGSLYGSQNYLAPDGEVLSRNHNQQLFAGPNATGHHQAFDSNQSVNPRALFIHQPIPSGPSQPPLLPYPLYDSNRLANSGSYEGALGSAGSISHNPFPSVDSGHSNVSPSVLPHAPHLENSE
ncbi:hypothetical protein BDV93DRAFT_556386 [Ceratobasidium sp. AG-I]|nr:hypothetical protein BDV93DRAFT_556386 [Ceratobasidium sp. AG-I]